MESSRSSKRRRLMQSYVSPLRPDLPATFESLNDDTLTTMLQFVGDKSYRSFGGVSKQCKEIYVNTKGMTKETFLFGYGPLSAIRDRIERATEDDDWELYDRVGKGVLFYNRLDVLEWALQQQNKHVLNGICNIAAEEGNMELLEEMWNNVGNEDDKEFIISDIDGHAAYRGKLDVLKWLCTKVLDIEKFHCAMVAARHAQLHILKWLRDEKGLELYGYLHGEAIHSRHLHIMKWLREQGCPWSEYTFRCAAYNGNLDILQYLHDEGCPWPDDDYLRIDEQYVKPEVVAWLHANGYADRLEDVLNLVTFNGNGIIKCKYADLMESSNTRSKRRKRRRLMSISSHVPPRRPDVPACFESLNDDTLTTVLEFVGNKSYRSFGGVNKHCKEVYLATKGMTKETFLYGYGPLSAIIDKIEGGEQIDPELHKRVGKGVVFYNRRDVLYWVLQQQKKYVLMIICEVAVWEGRIDILDEVWNYIMNNEGDTGYIFRYGDDYAARGGKLNVLEWYETKGLSIDKSWCARYAARYGQLHILQWFKEEQDLELFGTLYDEAIWGGKLNVMKWLREQRCPWSDSTFVHAALEGNLDFLQWLHDEGCHWPEDDDNYGVREEYLKPETVDWCRVNGYGNRLY